MPGLGTLLFMVDVIPGKFFNGFIMEVIGRRWSSPPIASAGVWFPVCC